MMQLPRFNDAIAERLEEPYRSGRYWTQPLLPMLKNRGSELGSELSRESFTTIDDLIQMAKELFTGLSKLGEYKYPLDVRKGVALKERKEVENMAYQDDSKTVKAGSKTYFFDIKETKEGKPYLVITESRFKGEGKDRERVSIVVFPEHAQEFLETIQEMIKRLG